jgi:hypothetical protein
MPDWFTGAFVALIPLAIVASILCYRLYDLDRIISRTLAYGLLTVLLGGAYVLVVLGGSQLLGQSRTLVVAAATLALAAIFQPARRRVQALVDRRFNRRRYDAARTIETFSAPAGRPGCPARGAARRGRDDHAAHPRVPLAPPRPLNRQLRAIRSGLT